VCLVTGGLGRAHGAACPQRGTQAAMRLSCTHTRAPRRACDARLRGSPEQICHRSVAHCCGGVRTGRLHGAGKGCTARLHAGQGCGQPRPRTARVVPAAGQGRAAGRGVGQRRVAAPVRAAAGRQRARALRLVELVRVVQHLQRARHQSQCSERWRHARCCCPQTWHGWAPACACSRTAPTYGHRHGCATRPQALGTRSRASLWALWGSWRAPMRAPPRARLHTWP